VFHYYSLGGDTTAPSGLYARLCHAFLVVYDRCRCVDVIDNVDDDDDADTVVIGHLS